MNAPFKIIPADQAPPISRSRYPFGRMKVGDYFEIPAGHPFDATSARNRLGTSARAWTKSYHPSARFATRIVTKDDGTIVVGCWRTA